MTETSKSADAAGLPIKQRIEESLAGAKSEKAWLLVSGTHGDGSWNSTRAAMEAGPFPMSMVTVQKGHMEAKEAFADAVKQIEGLVANPYMTSVLVDLDGPVDREVVQAWMKGLGEIASKGRMAAMVSKQRLEGYYVGNARALVVGAPYVPPELSSAFKARLEKNRDAGDAAAGPSAPKA